MLNLIQALRDFASGKPLTTQSTILSLWKRGLIEVTEIRNVDTPGRQREYLAVSVTEKGHRALISFAD